MTGRWRRPPRPYGRRFSGSRSAGNACAGGRGQDLEALSWTLSIWACLISVKRLHQSRPETTSSNSFSFECTHVPLSNRSAFRGSFGLNQTHERQFSYCQVIRFRLRCGSGSSFVTMVPGWGPFLLKGLPPPQQWSREAFAPPHERWDDSYRAGRPSRARRQGESSRRSWLWRPESPTR